MNVTICAGVKGHFGRAALPCDKQIPPNTFVNLGEATGVSNPSNAQKSATAVVATPADREN
jgi:hypothetical protein